MIRLITGVTRLNGRVLRPENGAFEADKKTEEYLVRVAGVAEFVNGTAEPTEPEPEPEADAPVIEAEEPAVTADAPKKPQAKKPAAKKS